MNPLPQLDAIPSPLAEEAFWHLFGRLEHERLDFKRGVPKDVQNTIPAMAMTDGGLIVHGIADDREIIGCPLSQNTQDRITRIAAECGVDVQLREIEIAPSATAQNSKAAPEHKLLTICAVPRQRASC